jgi:hypothetical protein
MPSFGKNLLMLYLTIRQFFQQGIHAFSADVFGVVFNKAAKSSPSKHAATVWDVATSSRLQVRRRVPGIEGRPKDRGHTAIHDVDRRTWKFKAPNHATYRDGSYPRHLVSPIEECIRPWALIQNGAEMVVPIVKP